jgi:ornithine carbamoyltransferase
MTRHFIGQSDLSRPEVETIFSTTARLKRDRFCTALPGRTLVMFFEKTSTRTRLSFEIGMTQLGGHAVYLDRDSSQLSRGESIEDTARVVSRYGDLMMARVYAHETVAALAANASIPVINGLSDAEHPCQSMADLFTISEHRRQMATTQIAYVGDGNNNVTHSLMIGAAMLGAHITVASPRQLQPDAAFAERARRIGRDSDADVAITDDPVQAVQGADVVYTDVWVSMGRESDRKDRLAMLQPYQVNAELVRHARPDYLFMHCLPAHVGEEVTPEVAYGPNSVIFDQAENRLHVQKALILFLHDCNQEERE